MSPVKNETLFAAWATVSESPHAYQASDHNHPPPWINEGEMKGLPRLVAALGRGLLLCISILCGSLLIHVYLLFQNTAFIFLFSRDVASPPFCSAPSSRRTGRACQEHHVSGDPGCSGLCPPRLAGRGALSSSSDVLFIPGGAFLRAHSF